MDRRLSVAVAVGAAGVALAWRLWLLLGKATAPLPAALRAIHSGSREVEVVVRKSAPTDRALLPLKIADRIWFTVPMIANSYRAYAFALSNCPPGVGVLLKAALAECLDQSAAFGFLSGRHDPSAGAVVDSNEGVPFTTVRVEHALPEGAEHSEELLYRLADIRPSAEVAAGRAPLATATLALFSDGGAVLAVSASHAVLDGEALMRFVSEWAACARGVVPTSAGPSPPREGRAAVTIPTIPAAPLKSWLFGEGRQARAQGRAGPNRHRVWGG